MRTLLIFLLLCGTAGAATLQWDYDEDHDRADGYTIYFSDGQNDYNYTFPVEESTVDEEEGTVEWGPIEEELNMHPDVEYEITLTRYNDTMESDKSNTVTWTRPAYDPPTDQLPDPVSPAPSGINGLGVE